MINKFSAWFVKLPIIVIVLFFLWFTPWVFVLKLGTLIYFPYAANGKDRFIRVSGPIMNLFSNDWVSGKEIPQFCKQALVAAEDEKFYNHFGVDIDSIEHSIKTNKKYKKMKRGGSTITQQLVKNAFLSRKKSYLRKAREIEGAILLNLIMSKESQLNWYFNIIEFGQNIYGIENASHFYFKKYAKNLTPSQCLALVTIIPAPKKWNKSLQRKSLTPFFVKRYDIILSNLKDMDIASGKDIYSAEQIHLWQNQIVNPLPEPQISPDDESEKDVDDEENK